MSVKENKELTRRFFENILDLNVLDEIVAKDFVFHSGQEVLHGLENFKQSRIAVRKAFPDFYIAIEEMVAEGDKVATLATNSGTFKGEFQGIPPNNKKVTIWGIALVRIVDGKIVEFWASMDTLSFMQQLGFIPSKK